MTMTTDRWVEEVYARHSTEPADPAPAEAIPYLLGAIERAAKGCRGVRTRQRMAAEASLLTLIGELREAVGAR